MLRACQRGQPSNRSTMWCTGAPMEEMRCNIKQGSLGYKPAAWGLLPGSSVVGNSRRDVLGDLFLYFLIYEANLVSMADDPSPV